MKALIVLVTLAGCTSAPEPVWIRPAGVSASQAKIDLYGCVFEAEKAVPSSSYTGHSNPIGSALSQEFAKVRIIKACARSKGYHPPGEG